MKNIKDSDSDLIFEAYEGGAQENQYTIPVDDDLAFSVDPEDAAYDEVHAIISNLPPGIAGKITAAYDAILSHRAKTEEEALQQLLGLLEDRAEAEAEDAAGGFGGPEGDFHDHAD